MKKVLLAGLIMAGFAVTANAQKGSILAYGNVSFATAKDDSKNSTTSFQINPGVGYQLNNNWTAGIEFGVGSITSKPNAGSYDKASNSTFNVGPFVRYSKTVAGPFSIFGQFNASYLGSKNKTTITNPFLGTTTSELKASGFGASLFPAVGINVKNGFALNVSFGGINFNTVKVDNAANSSSSFGFTFGKTVNIGISKNFGGKRK